ncbi:MAG: hypothetical protein ACI9EW_000606 [Cellvibrionaceae bacterium]|jgi:hypothetical protein
MSIKINRAQLLGVIAAAALLIYPFLNVASTFACNGGAGGICGG